MLSNLGEVTSWRQRILVGWIDTFEKVVEKYARRLKDGFRESIIQEALKALVDVDPKHLVGHSSFPQWLTDARFKSSSRASQERPSSGSTRNMY
jgi:hypothetical protein